MWWFSNFFEHRPVENAYLPGDKELYAPLRNRWMWVKKQDEDAEERAWQHLQEMLNELFDD